MKINQQALDTVITKLLRLRLPSGAIAKSILQNPTDIEFLVQSAVEFYLEADKTKRKVETPHEDTGLGVRE